MIRRITLTSLATLALLAVAACSSGPSVSGLGLFDGRTVRVNSTVDISFPITGERTWRIASFDSVYISPRGTPRITDERGGRVYHATFIAKTPGSTKIEFRSSDGRSRTFNLRILN